MALPIAALALLCAAPARAAEVWSSEGGSVLIEAGGYYKTFGAGLRLPAGLVEGTEALAALLDEARSRLPPERAALVPGLEPMPSEAALSTHSARAEAKLLYAEKLELTAAWQLGASVASHPTFAGGAALGGSPLAGSALARRRLVDFDPLLARGGSFRLQHDLDRLAVELSLRQVEVVVGRQVLGWGTGKLWSPTDLLSPFAPTDIDKEVRKGVDAVRVSIPLGTTGLLDALWLPQEAAADQGGVLRGQLNAFGYDLSLSAAKYVSDLVFGGDFSGDAGPLGVHGEAAWTLGMRGWSDGPLEVDERFWRAVLGVEWRPLERLVLLGEYHFNGHGAAEPEDYLAALASDRVARGEVFGAGRHYLGMVAAWSATDLVSLQATALVNLQDPSAMLIPVVEWSAEQTVLVRAGGFLPIGQGPDPFAIQRLTVGDVLQGTGAFQRAASTLGVRSEYGTSAAGAFVQVAVYR